MPYHYPRASGDRRIFRDDFLNLGMTIGGGGSPVGAALINRGLSGGQVIYYGMAHSVRYAGAVSIASHVIVSASGANQALWSIGTAASRRMEVGIDATGRPYAWGTAQVLLGTAVSDGHHDLGFSIGSDGSVWCVVDGELWGSGTVTFGSTFDRMLVGGSCLGTLPWAGETKDIHIYRGQMNEAEMAHAMGASVGFQPGSLLVGHDGLYFNSGLPNAVVDNGQPVFDGEFVDPTGWTVGPNWAIGAGLLTHTPGALNSTFKVAVTAGNRYVMIWNISRCVAGSGGASLMAATTRTSAGIYTEELTSPNTWVQIYPALLFDGDVDWVRSVANLSARQLTCQGNRGHFLQATAASMGWGSDPRAPTSKPVNGRKVVYFDGVADTYTCGAAADWTRLHNGNDFLVSMMFRNSSYPGLFSHLLGTSTGAGAIPGLRLVARSSNQVVVQMINGALGASVYSFTGGVIALAATNIVTVHHLNQRLRIRLNGVDILANQAPAVAFDANPPSTPLSTGLIAGSAPFAGAAADQFALLGSATADEADKVHKFQANRFGVALP